MMELKAGQDTLEDNQRLQPGLQSNPIAIRNHSVGRDPQGHVVRPPPQAGKAPRASPAGVSRKGHPPPVENLSHCRPTLSFFFPMPPRHPPLAVSPHWASRIKSAAGSLFAAAIVMMVMVMIKKRDTQC